MGATKRLLEAQMAADDRRKRTLIQLAEEGNEEAGNDLWREFGLLVDPSKELDEEAYTALRYAMEKED